MNIRFRGHGPLMMFYLLPEEIVARTELTDFPRDPYKALDDPHWREVYESDYFQLALCDTWAWLVWDHLGIRGGKEQYSGYDPFWLMAHAYSLWMRVFMAMGMPAERYFDGVDPGDLLRYLSHEETVYQFVTPMVEYYRKNSRFNDWRDTVQEPRTPSRRDMFTSFCCASKFLSEQASFR